MINPKEVVVLSLVPNASKDSTFHVVSNVYYIFGRLSRARPIEGVGKQTLALRRVLPEAILLKGSR